MEHDETNSSHVMDTGIYMVSIREKKKGKIKELTSGKKATCRIVNSIIMRLN
jgi:hypothetical protein